MDGNWISEDKDAPFGSSETPAQSGLFFRRIHLLVMGRVDDWKYKIEPDFASDNATGESDISFQDVYVARRVGPGELRIGQRRPFRGMEDLTSSNDILLMERPFAGSAGVFAGGQSREFALGLFYQGQADHMTWGVGGYSLRAIDTPGTEGVGVSSRLTIAPWISDGQILHLGLSASYENPANDQGATPSTTPVNIGTAVTYAGRRGPVAVLGLTSAAQPATTLGAELAGAFGPFFLQWELMSQHLEQAPGIREQEILAYYVQGSILLTGETKPYNAREGVFRSPKPDRTGGAWEVTGRFDEAGNRDASAIPGGCGGSALARECEARALTFGTNYYFNSSVRLMVNYVLGEHDRGRGGRDTPTTVAARFQFTF